MTSASKETRTCDIRNDRERSLAVEVAVVESAGGRYRAKRDVKGDVLLRPISRCDCSVMTVARGGLPWIVRSLSNGMCAEPTFCSSI